LALPGKAAVTGLLVFGLARLATAQMDDTAPVVSTSASSNYPEVTCTTSDAIACADTLQLAADTRDQLAPLLKLGRSWRFPVDIHIVTPDDPLAGKLHHEASAAIADNDSMRIEAFLPSSDPDARAFIQRQFVTAMLWEKFFAATKTFDTNTDLDVVPLWLREGLREWTNEDPGRVRESIVRKAVELQRAPTLSEVTGWQQLSQDKLMGLWQRSFCFYLVDSLVKPGPRRDDFQQWLATLAGLHPESAQFLFPTEMGWQHELVDATQRSFDIVYSWDQTMAALADAETITVPADKTSKGLTCSLDTVGSFPPDYKLIEAMRHKAFDLTGLELRAHPSWRPIMELYRMGLTDLINGVSDGNKLIRQASAQRQVEISNHEKLVNYINWFEVTKDISGSTTQFGSYFYTAEETERTEADPAHPNPIRENLLQVESQF